MQERLIRIKEVIKRTGLAKSTVWDKVKKNEFPKPIKLSQRVTVWIEDEINFYINTAIKKNRENG